MDRSSAAALRKRDLLIPGGHSTDHTEVPTLPLRISYRAAQNRYGCSVSWFGRCTGREPRRIQGRSSGVRIADTDVCSSTILPAVQIARSRAAASWLAEQHSPRAVGPPITDEGEPNLETGASADCDRKRHFDNAPEMEESAGIAQLVTIATTLLMEVPRWTASSISLAHSTPIRARRSSRACHRARDRSGKSKCAPVPTTLYAKTTRVTAISRGSGDRAAESDKALFICELQ